MRKFSNTLTQYSKKHQDLGDYSDAIQGKI
jgi:hypothetical protein